MIVLNVDLATCFDVAGAVTCHKHHPNGDTRRERPYLRTTVRSPLINTRCSST